MKTSSRILEQINPNFVNVKNMDWLKERKNNLTELFKKEYYCVEILFKYGSFNEVNCVSFSSKEELEDYKVTEFDEEGSNKWFCRFFFSDGFTQSYSLDL